MPRIKTPKYRRQRSNSCGDRAFVELNGQRYYLGQFGTPESRERYHALLAQWSANGGQADLPTTQDRPTISEVLAAFLQHAESHYVNPATGEPTSELHCFKDAMRVVKALYASAPADEFGPLAIKAVRQNMIEKKWARTNINAQIGRVRRIFKWAVAQEMIPPSVLLGLQAVTGLQRGRTDAKETDPVKPVPDAHIDAIHTHVSRQVWAIAQLQLLTGARPGELVIMRPVDLDTTGDVWTYRPQFHKTAYRGTDRTILIGPRAQAIIRPFLTNRAVDAYMFSPREAERERREQRHRARKTPVSCGNQPKSISAAHEERLYHAKYDVGGYRHAIRRACERAGVPTWAPHRLRHNAATQLRKQFGIDTAATILGHAMGSQVTLVYAERDIERARHVIQQVG